MDQIVTFLRKNYLSIGIAAAAYGIFLYSTYSGNRLCDCESTESYKPSTAGRAYGGARFYHK